MTNIAVHIGDLTPDEQETICCALEDVSGYRRFHKDTYVGWDCIWTKALPQLVVGARSGYAVSNGATLIDGRELL